jgi:hypothetical protein
LSIADPLRYGRKGDTTEVSRTQRMPRLRERQGPRPSNRRQMIFSAEKVILEFKLNMCVHTVQS